VSEIYNKAVRLVTSCLVTYQAVFGFLYIVKSNMPSLTQLNIYIYISSWML